MRKIFTISIILTICNIANAQELTLARALEEANSHRVENATNEVLIQLIEQRIQKNQKLHLLLVKLIYREILSFLQHQFRQLLLIQMLYQVKLFRCNLQLIGLLKLDYN